MKSGPLDPRCPDLGRPDLGRHCLGRLARLAVAVLALLQAGLATALERTRFAAPGGEETVLSIHAATDLSAMQPLIRDFQSIAPNVTIDYVEYVSNDLFALVQAACKARRATIGMDLVLSSGVDQLVKLVNDGCALRHRGPAAPVLPDWTRWRDEVFGFSFEPAVIVYNRDLVAAEDVPHTRIALIELLRQQPEKYAGRIGSYDIEQSGIGYLFTAIDASSSTTYGRLIEAFGRAGLRTRCCTADLLADLAAGRLAIGYNLLGSYAVDAVRRGAPLRVVIPRDYTVALSRAALVPVGAKEPVTAFRFIDYLVSAQGQKKAREASFFFGFDGDLPGEVDGPLQPSSLGLLRPITIGPELLAVQDRARRERFISDWRRSTQADRRLP